MKAFLQRFGPRAAVTLAALLAGMPASAQQPPLLTVPLGAGIHVVQAEVASTYESRAQGLMFRESLAPNAGMLFVFPETESHCMWMKNTLIPLSVAFIDAKGVIVSISDMRPRDETSHCAKGPAKYALEMPRGWFAARGIKAGTAIRGLDKAPPSQ